MFSFVCIYAFNYYHVLFYFLFYLSIILNNEVNFIGSVKMFLETPKYKIYEKELQNIWQVSSKCWTSIVPDRALDRTRLLHKIVGAK